MTKCECQNHPRAHPMIKLSLRQMLLFLEVPEPECKLFLLHDSGPASLCAHSLDAKDDQIDTNINISSPFTFNQ